MTGAVVDHEPRPVSVVSEVGERLWVLVVAGISTGVVVAGVGSRLAMLVLRLTSPDRVRGMTSDDGFEIGRFTLGGTYNLLLLGAAVGVIGAAAYRAVAPWLLGPNWFRRCTVAAASGVVVGSMLVHDDGIDFHALKPLWLAVGLFVALPAVFGAAIAAVVDRLAKRGLPAGQRRWISPVLLVVAFPPVIPLVAITALGLAAWVPAQRAVASSGGVPPFAGFVIRSGWAGVALLGLVALVRDVQALT
ncbi:MAG: hypothetical protein OEW83_19010 [Acidimicrobiia bacterium]|nr:hypothetical protein [Acidimicrobiia bacterium]